MLGTGQQWHWYDCRRPSLAFLERATNRATVSMQDGWQQQRELTLLYMRFYAVLLLGIMLTYQLQK